MSYNCYRLYDNTQHRVCVFRPFGIPWKECLIQGRTQNEEGGCHFSFPVVLRRCNSRSFLPAKPVSFWSRFLLRRYSNVRRVMEKRKIRKPLSTIWERLVQNRPISESGEGRWLIGWIFINYRANFNHWIQIDTKPLREVKHLFLKHDSFGFSDV